MTSKWWNVAPLENMKDFEFLSNFQTQITIVGIVLSK
jgi:hypothetical protein